MRVILFAALVGWAAVAHADPPKEPPPKPADPKPKEADKKEPAFKAEFDKIKAAAEKAQQEAFAGLRKETEAAKTEEEREKIQAKALGENEKQLAPRVAKAFEVVRPHAADPAAVEPLIWVLNVRPASKEATEAAALLQKHHLTDPKTIDAAAQFSRAPMPWTEPLMRALAAADLPKEKKPRALFALAELLHSKATFPDLYDGLDDKTKVLVEQMYGKAFIADLRNVDPAKLEAEAVKVLERIAAEYGAEKLYGDKTYADVAKATLFEIRHLSVGKPAPEIEGEDLDGAKFKLSDYKGKVVLLDFWGDW